MKLRANSQTHPDAHAAPVVVGGRTAFGVRPCDPKHAGERFGQGRTGLHCFRSREREDVDTLHRFLVEIGATVVHTPEDGPWAPGYYSVLFEDPDGIRLEMNHVPGKGRLADAGKSDAAALKAEGA